MYTCRIFTVLCAGFLLWMACTTDSDSVSGERAPLSEAIQVVDDNPKEALKLLERIFDPELLYEHNPEKYMQYIVVLTQAGYMNDQDITGDSLILDAQRYFSETQNYEMAARASYYAGSYWHEENVSDKTIEYWQAAFSFAEQAGNNLFKIKSAYGLGRLYYNQEQWEDALIYCQKASNLYDNKPDPEHYKLDIVSMLGQSYIELQNPKQAYLYLNKGLKAAKDLNDVTYESRFLRQIGIIHRDKGEYRQAKEYFDLALSTQPEAEDQLRIYLSYAKLYESMNRPDSALQYLKLIEGQIPGITYINTRRDIYEELATYYQTEKGDANKVARYSELARDEDARIRKNQNDKKIAALNQKHKQSEQKKQAEVQSANRMIKLWQRGLFLLLAVMIACFLSFLMKMLKLKQKSQKVSGKLLSMTINQQHFLMTGLRSVAKSTDVLYQKELAYPGSPVWDEQLVLRKEFCIQIAECAKRELVGFHNGKKALSQLALEDLVIIHMSLYRLSNGRIGWMLGQQGNRKLYIMIQKGQIRRTMASAGMNDIDIRRLLP